MRSRITRVLLLAVSATFIAMAGGEARHESADAESTGAAETALASNEGGAEAHANCAHSTPKEMEQCGETCTCGGDCMKPLSADAGETEVVHAEMAMAKAEKGGCPYMEESGGTCAKTGKPCGGAMTAEADAITDVVCGMAVGADSEFSTEHGDASYHFCSGDCRDTFTSEPGKYIQ